MMTRTVDLHMVIDPEKASAVYSQQSPNDLHAQCHRIFTVNFDLYGPLHCEVDNCGAECASIMLSKEEDDQLPDEGCGPEAVRHIFKNRLGVCVCDKHAPLRCGRDGCGEFVGEGLYYCAIHEEDRQKRLEIAYSGMAKKTVESVKINEYNRTYEDSHGKVWNLDAYVGAYSCYQCHRPAMALTPLGPVCDGDVMTHILAWGHKIRNLQKAPAGIEAMHGGQEGLSI